ncbi:MAG: type II secretion system minor pseudopilin GspK [Nitrospirae bacterium]|nr:type II secretion system minor pseudopilin GspK [Nitrospirota bacterium]
MRSQKSEVRSQNTEATAEKGFNSLTLAPWYLTLNKKGSALIIVLLIVAILTGLVVEFAYEVYIGTSALSNWQNAQKASLLSKSGQTLSLNYIKNLAGRSYTSMSDRDMADEIMPYQLRNGEQGSLKIKIIDENSKFNINGIIYPNGMTNENSLLSLKKLFEYLNINPSLALSIADWMDPDAEPRLSNSEYNAKNLYLWSIDELKLIRGMDHKTFELIKPFITVYGSGLININTAEAPVLTALHENMTEALAKKILDYREGSPFENKGQIVKVSGMEGVGIQIQNLITVKSSDFRIVASASVHKIIRDIESVMNTSGDIEYWREQ